MQALATAFGRLVQEREEGRTYFFARLDFIKFHPFQWKKCFKVHTSLNDPWRVLPDVILALVRSHLPKHSTEVAGGGHLISRNGKGLFVQTSIFLQNQLLRMVHFFRQNKKRD